MEHIERAGVHSGDSACVVPPVSIPVKHLETITDYTRKIAIELNVVGLMNIQYAIADEKVYVLEANPRASRTVPIVSKVCNIPMAKIATKVMLGAKLADLGLKNLAVPHFGVKESVFPFNMFPEVDPVLGPEMRSTGEVLGMADSFGLAFYKAQEATQQRLPTEGCVLITVADADKKGVVELARQFRSIGFTIKATEGTAELLAQNGVAVEEVAKLQEGRPNIVDAIVNGEVQLVVNTPIGKQGKFDDSYIRKNAIRHRIPYITTIAAATATATGIAAALKGGKTGVKSLQSYHADIS
jgi:carbamoyl-phosphate synthase large subunit